MFAITILIFAVIIVLVSALNQMARQRTDPVMIDLHSVRHAMMDKYGWTPERAEAAETEYVRFLTMLQMKPGFMLIPWNDAEGRDDLDQFWHQHILDTAKYAADCNAMFGRMIHHNPHVLRGSQPEQEAVDKTRRLYRRTFKSGPFGAEPKSEDTWSCSTCATVVADSGDSHSSHSGHDGGSGGHSGQSCGGGHSCGGHGCGHGCGSSCGGH